MAQTETKSALTARQIRFANLRYRDELNDEEIAKECGISRSTVYRWDEVPEIDVEMDRLAKADVKKAQRILERGSAKAAQTLLDLVSDKNWHKLFNQETSRKAAGDILQGAAIVGSKSIDQGNVNVFNFGGLGKMFEGIDTGAIRRLLDDLRNGDRKKGTPPVASRVAGTSHNEG